MSIFAGISHYYDEFRPGVPDELVAKLASLVPQDTVHPRLLDVGIGTGKVLEQFLPYFKDIVAIEPDIEMMALAKKRLFRHMPAGASIYFLDSSAEIAVFPPNWSASLVTICRAFHWMDRAQVLQRLDGIVEQNGVIAVFSDESFWTNQTPWTIEVKLIIQRYLGERRRVSGGIYDAPQESFADTFAQSAFSNVETFQMPVKRTWSVDQIIGYLNSTSFASQTLFGESYDSFVGDVRQRLQEIAPNGIFIEENSFNVLIAKRPQ